jgi:hypothetical protein
MGKDLGDPELFEVRNCKPTPGYILSLRLC